MLDYYLYDVFTDTPYAGNPLAVVAAADALSTAQMQAMAREFNLSETIFITAPRAPAAEGETRVAVRIFTPEHEMPFAGHPTVGCAVHLAGEAEGAQVVTLEEVAGPTPVRVTRQDGVVRAEFVAPVSPGVQDLRLTPEEIAQAVGLSAADLGPHRAHITTGGHPFVHIQVASRAALSRAAPGAGWARLAEVAGTGAVYLYAPGDEADFEARMFSPGAIGEDPATGSATALLSAQLLANGALSEGTNSFRLCQGRDMGRLSHLALSIDVVGDVSGDGAGSRIDQVRVAGGAVQVARGQIAPPV